MHVTTFSKFIQIKLSLFALPWTIASALFAVVYGSAKAERWDVWLWIALAFFAARTAGMSLNRLIDREIDAANPRTAQRMLPTGEVKVTEALTISLLALGLFVFACAMINPLCLTLSPAVLLLLVGYSYTKRWTAGCHFVLGFIFLLAPIMSWAAIQGDLALPPVLLGMASMLSIVGVEIIYATADVSFDRQYGLHSFPVYFGERNTYATALVLHGLVIVCLYFFGTLLDLSWIWKGALLLLGLRYALFYWQLFKKSNIENDCFSCNTSISMILLTATVGECLWHIMF